MSQPRKPSDAAIKAHQAPVREDFKTGREYALACKAVSDARIQFDQPKTKQDKKQKIIAFKRPIPVKRAKAGTSKAAAEIRKTAFAYAYIANGRNGTQAAIAAGFSPNGAEVVAVRLLSDVKVKAIISEATEKAAGIAGLSVDRTLKEIARLAYSDPRKLYDEDGQLIPVHRLDDDSAATIASVEISEEFDGRGDQRELSGYLKKVKVWDKNAALEKAMKFHGLYEKDNEQQKGDSLALMVVFGK